MPGSLREVKNAEEEGVQFVWLSAPEAFLGDNHVSGVRAVRMRLGLPDSSGRQSVEVVENSHFTVDADLVIKALGFDAEELPRLWSQEALEVTRWGNGEGQSPNIPDVASRGFRRRRHRARR